MGACSSQTENPPHEIDLYLKSKNNTKSITIEYHMPRAKFAVSQEKNSGDGQYNTADISAMIKPTDIPLVPEKSELPVLGGIRRATQL